MDCKDFFWYTLNETGFRAWQSNGCCTKHLATDTDTNGEQLQVYDSLFKITLSPSYARVKGKKVGVSLGMYANLTGSLVEDRRPSILPSSSLLVLGMYRTLNLTYIVSTVCIKSYRARVQGLLRNFAVLTSVVLLLWFSRLFFGNYYHLLSCFSYGKFYLWLWI